MSLPLAEAPVRPAPAPPHALQCPQSPGRPHPARPLPAQGQALVGAALGIGVRQDVVTADLVVQGVEAITGFRLRFCVQRHLQPVYVEDVAEAVVRILRAPAASQPYELAGPRVYTYQELLRII